MKRSRFTEEQIIGILKEHEAGAKTETSAASTASRMQPSTNTRRSMAAWICPTLAS